MSISTDGFLGFNANIDFAFFKTNNYAVSISLDLLTNCIQKRNYEHISITNISYPNSNYYIERVDITQAELHNVGSLGLSTNINNVYLGFGISYQEFRKIKQSTIETIFENQSGAVLMPSAKTNEINLPNKESIPIYFKLGVNQHSVNNTTTYFFGYSKDFSKKTNHSQFFVGFLRTMR